MNLQRTIEQHINRVRIAKTFLIALLSVLLVIGAIVFSAQREESYSYDVEQSEEESAGDDTNTKIENPKFYGFDADKNPFTVVAKEGAQLSENLVELKEVFSEIRMQNDNIINLASDVANMDLNSKNLSLDKNVHIVIDKEYVISTDHAEIDLNKNSVRGDRAIYVESKGGTISANSFATNDSFNSITMKNGVHTILNP